MSSHQYWLLCPICKNKTRIRLREDTELKNFPLYCPKCKQKTLIGVKHMRISVIQEPDAQTQRADNTQDENAVIGSVILFGGTSMLIAISHYLQSKKALVLAWDFARMKMNTQII